MGTNWDTEHGVSREFVKCRFYSKQAGVVSSLGNCVVADDVSVTSVIFKHNNRASSPWHQMNLIDFSSLRLFWEIVLWLGARSRVVGVTTLINDVTALNASFSIN